MAVGPPTSVNRIRLGRFGSLIIKRIKVAVEGMNMTE